ncbi:uncharacterized protein [Zea mays]|uniref:uncharacterized protein n=1 Tax=Zea mays TaxID=4577 RepID=UPI0004DEB00F|nr:uncharacterized protein LOC103628146 [Zea mays]|eukprot:XP_008646628.1 uncharacterized protein LOC103628146 [Zea mays]
MGWKRKELLSSVPWRTGEAAEDEDTTRMSQEGKVSVTSNHGETPTMSVPWSKRQDLDLTIDDFEEDEIDPELCYSFQRNSRVPYTPNRPSFFWFNDFPCSCSMDSLTGPILAGLTQSFLDAINNGAVPTISSSWQSVEEAECQRAFDSAVGTYNSSFDHNKHIEEDSLREAHEDAMRKAISAFNVSAVVAGSARSKFEKLLHSPHLWFLKNVHSQGSPVMEAHRNCCEFNVEAYCFLPWYCF